MLDFTQRQRSQKRESSLAKRSIQRFSRFASASPAACERSLAHSAIKCCTVVLFVSVAHAGKKVGADLLASCVRVAGSELAGSFQVESKFICHAWIDLPRC